MKLTKSKLQIIIREELKNLTESQLNQDLEDLKFKIEDELNVDVHPVSRTSMEVHGQSGVVNIKFEAFEFQIRGDKKLVMRLKDVAGNRYSMKYYGTH